MAVTRKPTRKVATRPTRRPNQLPRKGGSPPAVLAQPTNLQVEEV
ncbi:hypothetical protein SAMN04487957_110139 [Halomonas shengliensis]|uniref:Uncharacterized protein n=1 Tax=Halomonas shengliensis TaxID=419597 RepID=A0A1H0LX26_9GAMM|nr:hypothetical protein [Halomonas shengliensis]SDO72707.1 hypothetical protein SAMN04487957_110139 [Halomonas shengliensis]